MKNYMVLVESEDYISVDAENDEEAEQKAVDIFSRDLTHECKATVLHSTGPDAPEEETCDIPY